ncbi:MAG: sigma-E factor regulatory protein RseB domain-containing protein, partial [Terracoccus sp.]
MRRSWRWGVLVALVVALVALPFVVAALPVGPPASDAASVLVRMEQSVNRPYEGYAETTGTVGLPASDGLDNISSLLGGRTQQRVWWRSTTDWRDDTITPTGEEGAYSTATHRAVWSYEDNRAVVTEADPQGAIRLPRAADTLPPLLAARLLSEATPALVSALPSARVAGRAADGLRLRPGDPLSSIDRVDVWADRESGIPVRVEVYGRGAQRAALSST